VVKEPFSDEATRLLADWIADGTQVTTPALFVYEAANVLFLRVANGQFLLAEAKQLLIALMRRGPVIPVNLNIASHLKAIDLAARFSLDGTYDPHYLALAEAAGCDFWTADKKLVDIVGPALGWVHWIGERRGKV
jgi:predicted nucleic acid-binding protein